MVFPTIVGLRSAIIQKKKKSQKKAYLAVVARVWGAYSGPESLARFDPFLFLRGISKPFLCLFQQLFI